MTVYQHGTYVLRAIHEHLIEVRKEDGTTYRVALDPAGTPMLCTCEGHRRYWRCKHVELVHAALRGEGIPSTSGAVVRIKGYGTFTAALVMEGGRDPFARIEASAVR